MFVSTHEHWNAIYAARPCEELGWYEPAPSTLHLVMGQSDPADAIIDVGAGAGPLIAALVELGYHDLTALDLSGTALDAARAGLGPEADGVEWIQADVTRWTPQRTWDVWHDRAVFHFLTSSEEREAYKATALSALAPNGRLVVAAFSADGPERCAGLPVERYDSGSLAATFAPELQVQAVELLVPGQSAVGDQRPYLAAVLKRVAPRR